MKKVHKIGSHGAVMIDGKVPVCVECGKEVMNKDILKEKTIKKGGGGVPFRRFQGLKIPKKGFNVSGGNGGRYVHSVKGCECADCSIWNSKTTKDILKEFEKRFFLTIKLSYNVQCVELKSFIRTAIDQTRKETIEECNKTIAEMKLEGDYFYAKRNVQETLSDVIERLEKLK